MQCLDPVIGGILAGWRYDISGIAPDMRGDYEHHLATCEHCRARQALHRRIDLGLIALTSLSAVVFLAAIGVIWYIAPRHQLLLLLLAAGGFGVSVAMCIMVAIATPAPLVVKDAALESARRIHDRLPENVRARIPEEVRARITGESSEPSAISHPHPGDRH
jgi:anti-sigma factor RsiW